MRDKKQNDPGNVPESDRFANLSDEELMEIIKVEGSKDASVLAKLIMIQRIRISLVRERMWQRIMTGSAIFLSIIAILVGGGGYLALQNFLDEREERVATSCRDDRDDAINYNRAIEEDIEDLYFIESLAVNPEEDPVEAAFLRAAIDSRVIDIRQNYQKVRSCTQEHIDRYNETRGEEGFEPGPMVVQAKRLDPVEVPNQGDL